MKKENNSNTTYLLEDTYYFSKNDPFSIFFVYLRNKQLFKLPLLFITLIFEAETTTHF